MCCFRLQRYKFLKAIHNAPSHPVSRVTVVSDYKDTNFWKQFTTVEALTVTVLLLFQTTKIQIFESNSQPKVLGGQRFTGCFRLQRYKFLKAIHNVPVRKKNNSSVVSDYKDTNFWKQFTTIKEFYQELGGLFQTTKIQIFESNSQHKEARLPRYVCCFRLQRYKFLKAIHNINNQNAIVLAVVSDYKDTNFWKQFTTTWSCSTHSTSLFQTTKIQIFESNSQPVVLKSLDRFGCFRLQRYKFLKAIHNTSTLRENFVDSTGKVIKKRARRFE